MLKNKMGNQLGTCEGCCNTWCNHLCSCACMPSYCTCCCFDKSNNLYKHFPQDTLCWCFNVCTCDVYQYRFHIRGNELYPANKFCFACGKELFTDDEIKKLTDVNSDFDTFLINNNKFSQMNPICCGNAQCVGLAYKLIGGWNQYDLKYCDPQPPNGHDLMNVLANSNQRENPILQLVNFYSFGKDYDPSVLKKYEKNSTRINNAIAEPTRIGMES